MSFIKGVPKPRKIVRPIGLNGKTETQFVDNVSPRIILDLKHMQSGVEPIPVSQNDDLPGFRCSCPGSEI